MFKSVINANKQGNTLLDVPKCMYNYVTIFNDTHFDFTLYKGYTEDEEEIIGSCPAYTMLTFPLDKSADSINVVWRGSSRTDFEKCMVFFTEDNLAISSTFNPPQLEGVGRNTTRIIGSDIIVPNDIQSILRQVLFSTSTTLNANEIYEPAPFNLLTWKCVTGMLTSDRAGVLSIEESFDDINYHLTKTHNLVAGEVYTFVHELHSQNIKFKFQNGSIAQTNFAFCGYGRVL